MLGSGLNLVSVALGFGMTAAFIAFVCARFACCRARGDDSGPPPSLDFSADLDGAAEHTRSGLEPLVIAAIPTMKYHCEAFCSEDDAQCSICLGEYKEKDVLRIIPTCRHNFHLACLDLWLQKQTTCPICRVSLKELQGAMTSACSIQQLTTVPENSVDPTAQCVLPVCQDQRGQSNSQESTPVQYIATSKQATATRGQASSRATRVHAFRYAADRPISAVPTSRQKTLPALRCPGSPRPAWGSASTQAQAHSR